MKAWVAGLAVAGLFIAGILVGALGLLVYHLNAHPAHSRSYAWDPNGPVARGRGPELHLRLLERRLDLSPEQLDQIQGILRQAQQESQALREELRPKVLKILDDSHAQVLEVLTPEQRATFEEIQSHHRPGAERFLLGEGPFSHRRHFHERPFRDGRREGLRRRGVEPAPAELPPPSP